MAKAVKNKQQQNKQRKPAPAGKPARTKGKEVEEQKAPSRWSRARSRAKQTGSARSAARPVAKTERRGLRKFIHDVRMEMAKVTWPTRKDLIQSTIVVIVAVVIMGAFVGALDAVFSRIVDGLLNLIGA